MNINKSNSRSIVSLIIFVIVGLGAIAAVVHDQRSPKVAVLVDTTASMGGDSEYFSPQEDNVSDAKERAAQMNKAHADVSFYALVPTTTHCAPLTVSPKGQIIYPSGLNTEGVSDYAQSISEIVNDLKMGAATSRTLVVLGDLLNYSGPGSTNSWNPAGAPKKPSGEETGMFKGIQVVIICPRGSDDYSKSVVTNWETYLKDRGATVQQGWLNDPRYLPAYLSEHGM